MTPYQLGVKAAGVRDTLRDFSVGVKDLLLDPVRRRMVEALPPSYPDRGTGYGPHIKRLLGLKAPPSELDATFDGQERRELFARGLGLALPEEKSLYRVTDARPDWLGSSTSSAPNWVELANPGATSNNEAFVTLDPTKLKSMAPGDTLRWRGYSPIYSNFGGTVKLDPASNRYVFTGYDKWDVAVNDLKARGGARGLLKELSKKKLKEMPASTELEDLLRHVSDKVLFKDPANVISRWEIPADSPELSVPHMSKDVPYGAPLSGAFNDEPGVILKPEHAAAAGNYIPMPPASTGMNKRKTALILAGTALASYGTYRLVKAVIARRKRKKQEQEPQP